ncbi:hypothetical protein [Rhodococcus sp. H29-C3]|uniref:hypothetical protein n=1 Tax=Rhodococcus sp. H29-C3 TaxID=3046307 RepID=UPI0024B997FA|nr:hypothetical protein [Rhodococcus sp. H29-C3]MDJ0361855.1 hypothetical protein [Rhodococcus sp. H29-C3]
MPGAETQAIKISMRLRKSADLVRENVTADRTPTEIAESIRNDAGIDLAPMRDYLATVYGTARRPSVGRGPSIVAPSVELDDVTVRVFVGTSDPSFLGTFDRTAGTRMVTVAVHARLNRTGEEPQGHPPPAVDLPVRERIAWTRAVLGELADYAYRILNDRAQLRPLPALFVAFTDATAPRLAPSDFRWLYLCGGRRAYPEKVVPESQELLAHLRRHGDIINADLVARPIASEPAVWAHEFVSTLTATLADQLGRMRSGKWFTIEEVTLHGLSRVTVRYTWHLVAGDKAFAYDIDLAGVRAEQLRKFDDGRAQRPARIIGATPFSQPVFRSPHEIDGVTWVKFGRNGEN